jgi:hypothetical protein
MSLIAMSMSKEEVLGFEVEYRPDYKEKQYTVVKIKRCRTVVRRSRNENNAKDIANRLNRLIDTVE